MLRIKYVKHCDISNSIPVRGVVKLSSFSESHVRYCIIAHASENLLIYYASCWSKKKRATSTKILN